MKVIKNSIIYLGSEIINKAVPFILMPLITKYFTPLEYGIYAMYQVIFSLFLPFLSMNLSSQITINYFKVSKEKMQQILNNIILILHLNFLLGLGFIFIISIFKDNIFGINTNFLYIMPIIIYVQMLNLFNLTLLRNKENATKYAIYQFTFMVLNVFFTFILIIGFNYGWKSLVYSVLLSYLIIILFVIKDIKEEYRFSLHNINYQRVITLYKLSIPLIFHLLGGSIIFLSDRIFIKEMIGLNEVGIYSIGSQFGLIVTIVISAILMAVNPFIFKKLSNNISIKKYIFMLMFLFLLLGHIIIIISKFIYPYLVDKNYYDGIYIIYWIALAMIFRGWYQLYYNIIVFYNKTVFFAIVTLISAILNIILNYFLIKINGIIGTAQATMITFLFMFIVSYFYALKLRRNIDE